MNNSSVIVLRNLLIMYMGKNYSKSLKVSKRMKPDKEVVSFLLSYSKALKVVKTKDKLLELIVN